MSATIKNNEVCDSSTTVPTPEENSRPRSITKVTSKNTNIFQTVYQNKAELGVGDKWAALTEENPIEE
eukprot:5157768-Amphidinium_carterae.1